MAANLTPQYYKAEDAYRKARTPAEKVSTLEEMLRQIPKHKGTDHLQAQLKSRLREARQALVDERQSPRPGRSWRIPRQGCATIIVIGPPNSGKSRLVSELTNAKPVIADYPFTTHEPLAGILKWEQVSLQLIDTPPIAAGHLEAYLVDFVRTADRVLCCVDGRSDDAPQQLLELFQLLDERKTRLSTIGGFDPEDFSRVLVPCDLVVTHAHDPMAAFRGELCQSELPEPLPLHLLDFDDPAAKPRLAEAIYRGLNVIRVYTKRPGVAVEYVDPYVLPAGSTVENLAEKVHEEFVTSLKFAKVFQRGKESIERVGRQHVLQDNTVVELHTR